MYGEWNPEQKLVELEKEMVRQIKIVHLKLYCLVYKTKTCGAKKRNDDVNDDH